VQWQGQSLGSLGLGQMLSWDQALVQGLKEYLHKHIKLISNLANIHLSCMLQPHNDCN